MIHNRMNISLHGQILNLQRQDNKWQYAGINIICYLATATYPLVIATYHLAVASYKLVVAIYHLADTTYHLAAVICYLVDATWYSMDAIKYLAAATWICVQIKVYVRVLRNGDIMQIIDIYMIIFRQIYLIWRDIEVAAPR